jgi:polyferredoxin
LVDIKKAILRIRTVRIATLIIFFLLFNAALFGVSPLPLLVPVLVSLGTPTRTVGDAFSAVQYMLWDSTFPWLPIASFLIVAVLVGRMMCGWVCPFGFVQEILGYIKRRHMRISSRTHRDIVYIKFAILGVVLFVSITMTITTAMRIDQGYKDALGIFAQAPFNVLSPHDTLFSVLPTMTYQAFLVETPFQDILGGIVALSPIFWTRLFILGLVLAFAVYVPRSWWLYFCPVGAALALLNNFSFIGLKRDVVHCTKDGCRSCVESCPMKVPILDLPWERFTHPECIYCLECIDSCETKALKPKLF